MRHTTTKTFSLPPALADTLAQHAADLGVPESTLVRWALEKHFNMRSVGVTIVRKQKGKKK